MFTGIIEEIGTVQAIDRRDQNLSIRIAAKKIIEDLQIDHSVAIDGACLTAVAVDSNSFTVDAVAETLARTTLAQLKMDDRVNLERALRLQDRLGGHLVQGHVDGIGRIVDVRSDGKWSFEIPPELQQYTIFRGSIAIDGVSLTITNRTANIITVALIPHTLQHTIFQFKRAGDAANIEVDLIAKYIEQLLSVNGKNKMTVTWLKEIGFE